MSSIKRFLSSFFPLFYLKQSIILSAAVALVLSLSLLSWFYYYFYLSSSSSSSFIYLFIRYYYYYYYYYYSHCQCSYQNHKRVFTFYLFFLYFIIMCQLLTSSSQQLQILLPFFSLFQLKRFLNCYSSIRNRKMDASNFRWLLTYIHSYIYIYIYIYIHDRHPYIHACAFICLFFSCI